MRFTFMVAALLAGASQAAPHSPSGNGHNVDLNKLAQRRGLHWFGTAADIPGTAETTDAAYLKVLRKNFGEVTPANAMKVWRYESTLSTKRDTILQLSF